MHRLPSAGTSAMTSNGPVSLRQPVSMLTMDALPSPAVSTWLSGTSSSTYAFTALILPSGGLAPAARPDVDHRTAGHRVAGHGPFPGWRAGPERKSTRLNSSHLG